MTLPSRLLIKSSLIYFVIGAFLGALLLVNKAFIIEPAVWAILPVHIELMIFGWIIQFTLGVAYWILPRFLEGEARGNSFFAYLMVFAFNVGIWLKIAATLSQMDYSLDVAARVCQLIAVALFISLHWKRIVTYNRGAH